MDKQVNFGTELTSDQLETVVGGGIMNVITSAIEMTAGTLAKSAEKEVSDTAKSVEGFAMDTAIKTSEAIDKTEEAFESEF